MNYRYFNEATRTSVLKAVSDVGNAAAWQRFFDLYAGYVFAIARKKGLTDMDADDVVQLVFADLVRILPEFSYDRTKGRFRSYLTGLVNWRVMDKLRSNKRDSEQLDAYKTEAKVQSTIDSDFAERQWHAAALDEALRRIKPEVRPEHYAAFYASTIEGQDVETVMQLYNLSRDNLYQIRKRLTAKVKQKVTEVLAEMESPTL